MLKNLIAKFQKDEDGVTAVEYGIMAALISAVLVTAVTALTGGLTVVFARIATHLT